MRQFAVLILILCFAVPVHTFAQAADISDRQWAAVTLLQAGVKLEIRLKSGEKVQGTLDGSSAAGLILADKTGTTSIYRADIRRLYLVRGRSPLKSAAMGTGVGAASGAVLGAVSPGPCWCAERIEVAVFTAALGTMLGAITGVTMGLFRHRRSLVYAAP